MQVRGLGVHLWLARPAHHHGADQCHPPVGAKDTMSTRPSDRRIDPVPRRCSDQQVEAAPAVVPVLEPRCLDLDVLEPAHPIPGDRGQCGTRLDGGDRPSELSHRTRRLAGPAAHLQDVGPVADPRDGGEVGEELARVARPHSLVQLGHLVEQLAEVAPIVSCHQSRGARHRARPAMVRSRARGGPTSSRRWSHRRGRADERGSRRPRSRTEPCRPPAPR